MILFSITWVSKLNPSIGSVYGQDYSIITELYNDSRGTCVIIDLFLF